MSTHPDYQVEGYGKNPDYDGPYLGGHDFDPRIVFATSGAPGVTTEAEIEYAQQVEDFKARQAEVAEARAAEAALPPGILDEPVTEVVNGEYEEPEVTETVKADYHQSEEPAVVDEGKASEIKFT